MDVSDLKRAIVGCDLDGVHEAVSLALLYQDLKEAVSAAESRLAEWIVDEGREGLVAGDVEVLVTEGRKTYNNEGAVMDALADLSEDDAKAVLDQYMTVPKVSWSKAVKGLKVKDVPFVQDAPQAVFRIGGEKVQSIDLGPTLEGTLEELSQSGVSDHWVRRNEIIADWIAEHFDPDPDATADQDMEIPF